MTTPQYDQAVEVHNAFDTAVQKVQTDPNTTFTGKQVTLAKLWVAADDRLTALSLAEQSTARRNTLRQQLLGLPTGAPTADTVSYRDALDRVSSIDYRQPGAQMKLRSLYDNAQISGDAILAKAVLGQAITDNDQALINTYIDDHPTVATDIAEYLSLLNRQPDYAAQMIYGLMKPKEIAALTETQIRSLADPKYAEQMDAKAKDDFITAWSSMFPGSAPSNTMSS